MAETQEFALNGGEDFAQDVKEQEQQLNGGGEDVGAGDAARENGSAEAPGRDDDRYDLFIYHVSYLKSIRCSIAHFSRF